MNNTNQDSIYSFSATSIDGKEIPLSQYREKVLLIVNTASDCGFTSQYEGLQKLYEELKDDNFVILGFPCNQFGGQEPESENVIQAFCQVNYGVTFPMFEKINVNGADAHPLYQWLKKEKTGLLGQRIKWNFTKFLVDQNGQVIQRYAANSSPASIKDDILRLF